MDKKRVSSVAVALWAILQVCFLVLIGSTPESRPLGWVIFAVAVVLAGALWRHTAWAQLVALTLTVVLLCSYGVAALRYGIPCGPGSIGCLVEVLSQPLLAALVFITLVAPWPLTFVGADREG